MQVPDLEWTRDCCIMTLASEAGLEQRIMSIYPVEALELQMFNDNGTIIHFSVVCGIF